MLSSDIKNNLIKISALFDYYEDLSKRTLKNKSDLSATKEKMFFVRKQIIELTSAINLIIKNFEKNL